MIDDREMSAKEGSVRGVTASLAAFGIVYGIAESTAAAVRGAPWGEVTFRCTPATAGMIVLIASVVSYVSRYWRSR